MKPEKLTQKVILVSTILIVLAIIIFLIILMPSEQKKYAEIFIIILSIIITIIIMIILFYITWAKPIISLKEYLKKIAEKDSDTKNDDEINKLTTTFDHINAGFKKSSEQLKKDNVDLEIKYEKKIRELNKKIVELKESEKRFQDVTLSTGDFIWEMDHNGKYTRAWGDVQKILGYVPEELKGMSPSEIVSKDDAERVEKVISEAMLKISPIINLERWSTSKDNRKVYLITNAVPILDENGALLGYRGVDKDFSERKNIEAELTVWENEIVIRDKQLTDMNKKLEDANNKLQTLDKQKDEFISLTAHELKTPLTSIRGFTQLLQDESVLSDKEQRSHYIDLINKNTDRLYTLVLDVVDSSRLSLGKLKLNVTDIDTNKLFMDIKENMSIIITTKGLILDFFAEPSIPFIRADYERTMQVLRNLISNSVKFTEKGSISLKVYHDGDFVKFEVKDTGQGIPKENFNSIFSRFYQVDSSMTRKIGGSGLGLSICKGLVEGMGGLIGFDSESGKGSTFYFTIPISKNIT